MFRVGVRTGRPTRRRSGRAVVARAFVVLFAVVAAGDAVPLEHEVPTRLGAALRLLRGRSNDPAGGRRLGDRRGLPGAAVQPAQRTAHRPSLRPCQPALVGVGLLHRGRLGAGRVGVAADRPRSSEERERRLPEQVRVRLSKLKMLQDSGIDAYPVGQPPSHTVAQALGIDDQTTVSVSGRVLRIRDFGGVLFAQLRDWSAEVQVAAGEFSAGTRTRPPISPKPSISATWSR